MSTHIICFHGEIRKILCGYPLLSVAIIKISFSMCTWVIGQAPFLGKRREDIKYLSLDELTDPIFSTE